MFRIFSQCLAERYYVTLGLWHALSICRLSVTLLHPIGRDFNFSEICLRHLIAATWPVSISNIANTVLYVITKRNVRLSNADWFLLKYAIGLCSKASTNYIINGARLPLAL